MTETQKPCNWCPTREGGRCTNCGRQVPAKTPRQRVEDQFDSKDLRTLLRRYDAMESLLREIAAEDLGDGDYFEDRIRTLLETP